VKKLFWIAAFFMTLSLGLIIFVFFFAKETDGRLKLAILTIGYLLFFFVWFDVYGNLVRNYTTI